MERDHRGREVDIPLPLYKGIRNALRRGGGGGGRHSPMLGLASVRGHGCRSLGLSLLCLPLPTSSPPGGISSCQRLVETMRYFRAAYFRAAGNVTGR